MLDIEKPTLNQKYFRQIFFNCWCQMMNNSVRWQITNTMKCKIDFISVLWNPIYSLEHSNNHWCAHKKQKNNLQLKSKNFLNDTPDKISVGYNVKLVTSHVTKNNFAKFPISCHYFRALIPNFCIPTFVYKSMCYNISMRLIFLILLRWYLIPYQVWCLCWEFNSEFIKRESCRNVGIIFEMDEISFYRLQ